MPAAKWNDPRLHYRFIEGDLDLAPGVRLIESSGHVPAHQSVLVRLERSGAYVLAIDAIPFGNQRDADTRPIGPYDMDEAAVRASTRKLVALAASEGAQLIHGHDGIQWAGLRKSPEYYD
jgi:N-acyl homoserine lactone hydrolase